MISPGASQPFEPAAWRTVGDTSREARLWRASGADRLTGYPDGPPGRGPGAPASVVQAVLDSIRAVYPAAQLPGVDLLSLRARLAGFTRNAPWSCGGAFRVLPCLDGWVGLSLARESDLELIPALLEHELADTELAWDAVAGWLARTGSGDAVDRFAILGLPGAAVPVALPGARRQPILVTPGGSRTAQVRPLVVDLTSLWAGPLCANLLGRIGARVVKVESSRRLDGARRGPASFFDWLHAGHESVVVDFTDRTGRAQLLKLLERADVVLEASRPRALRQLGIDAEAFAAHGTIWLSITAYGRLGADAMRVGFGDDVAAAAGIVGWDERGPYPVGDAIADPLAGVVAAAAAVAALQGDRGALLDLSMYDLAAWVAGLA